MGLGAIQFGVMYLAYIQSYQYLPGYLVAVFTIFTPVYVMLLETFFGDRKSLALAFSAAGLSVAGAAVIVFKVPEQAGYLTGLLILQIANIAFAIGQWTYQRWAPNKSQAGNMFWMYLGAALFASLVSFPQLDWSAVDISQEQVLVLLYMGIVASAGCFYLWNSGAKLVPVPALAAMNNGYIPFAVLFSVLFWGESADWARLIPGMSLIALSLWVAYRIARAPVIAMKAEDKADIRVN